MTRIQVIPIHFTGICKYDSVEDESVLQSRTHFVSYRSSRALHYIIFRLKLYGECEPGLFHGPGYLQKDYVIYGLQPTLYGSIFNGLTLTMLS